MKTFAIVGICALILGILVYAYHMLNEYRLMRLGRCWGFTRDAMEDLVDRLRDNYFEDLIKDRSMKDVEAVNRETLIYRGDVNIDEAIDFFDPDCAFFKHLKDVVNRHWHFDESPFGVILNDAIYAYNIEREFSITKREFINYLTAQFEFYFVHRL